MTPRIAVMATKWCFVISPIGDEGTDTRNRSDLLFNHIIRPVVEPRGYQPIRADMISEPGIITNQIINHLVNDELVIADLSDHNANVFYELAIRHAVRKPVIQIIEKGQRIPFDVSPARTIMYGLDLESAANSKGELATQLSRVESARSVDNPVTVAIASVQTVNIFNWLTATLPTYLEKGIIFREPDSNCYYLLDKTGLFRQILDDDTLTFLESAVGIFGELPTVSYEEVQSRLGRDVPQIKKWERPPTPEEVAKQEAKREREYVLRDRLRFEYNFNYDADPQELSIHIANVSEEPINIISIEFLPVGIRPLLHASHKVDRYSSNMTLLNETAIVPPGESLEIALKLSTRFNNREPDKWRNDLGYVTVWVHDLNEDFDLLYSV